MLVFILLMGEYLIPALLGGGKVFFIGNALVDLFLQSRNWPFGAALRRGWSRHAGDRHRLHAILSASPAQGGGSDLSASDAAMPAPSICSSTRRSC